MGYKTTPYSDKYLSSLSDLLDRTFGIRADEKEDVIRWKYFTPLQKQQSITYLAVTPQEKVIGQYTNTPIPTSHKTTQYNSLYCMDMATDEDYRGLGIMRALSTLVYKDVTEKKFDFTVGFSNTVGVRIDRSMKQYGYTVVGKLKRYYKFPLHKRNSYYTLKPARSLDKHFLKQYRSDFFRVQKSHVYLTWRYRAKPGYTYSIYEVLLKNSFQGFVVVRRQSNKIYVLDLIVSGENTAQIQGIFAAVENMAFSEKCKVVIYNVLENHFWKLIFSRPTYMKIDANSSRHFFTIKVHKKLENVEQILNPENWLIMGGDIL